MFNLFCVRTPQGKWLLQLHHVCLQCNCRLCLVFKNKMYFLQTYTKENGFIITQYPSQDQVAEFIRNIVDYECRTVIFLDPLHNINSVRAFLIVPSLVYDNWLLPLLSMTWCFPNCCLYFPTYWGIKYVNLFYKAIVPMLQTCPVFVFLNHERDSSVDPMNNNKLKCLVKTINLSNWYKNNCALLWTTEFL